MADPATPAPAPGADRLLSVEEYFALEEASPVRHEYVAGEIHAMTGVTRRHSRIAGNVFARVWAAARGGPCRVHQAEVKLRVGEVIYYPDVMVACGSEPADPRIEDAPCRVAEVLSPSTASIDRREKTMVYRGIATLGAYLVIDQERRSVERHWRDGDGGWRRTTLTGAAEVPLPCPALVLTLDEIYEGVDFYPGDARLRVREEVADRGV